jgi:hypothetical protein
VIGFEPSPDITYRQLLWMDRGKSRRQRAIMTAEHEDAWWRMAFLRAEIHNGALGQIKVWGGAQSANFKSPKDMNPLEGSTPSDQHDRQSEEAFALAARQEQAKRELNGKQSEH